MDTEELYPRGYSVLYPRGYTFLNRGLLLTDDLRYHEGLGPDHRIIRAAVLSFANVLNVNVIAEFNELVI